MQTNVIGSDQDERYWFHARIVARRESYRQLYGVPPGLNPWALRVRSRVGRFTPEWGGWTPREAGFLVDLFQRDAVTRERDGQYEQIREYVACVVAETGSQARSRVETHLEHGSFDGFELHEIERGDATDIESTPAATRAIEHQTAVHPLIGGEYTPHVPEVHLGTDTEGTIGGVVRLLMADEQLQTQVARARERRQRVYDWGRFKLSLELGQPANEQLLTILGAIGDNERGTLIGSVSLTDETPDSALALLLDHDRVDRMLDVATRRSIDPEETAQWKVPIAPASLDRFLTHAETALETDASTVVGPSPFLDANEDEPIAAMVTV